MMRANGTYLESLTTRSLTVLSLAGVLLLGSTALADDRGEMLQIKRVGDALVVFRADGVTAAGDTYTIGPDCCDTVDFWNRTGDAGVGMGVTVKIVNTGYLEERNPRYTRWLVPEQDTNPAQTYKFFCHNSLPDDDGNWVLVFDAQKTGVADATLTIAVDCTGTDCTDDPCGPADPPSPIPTVSTWGLVAMALLILAAGTIVVRRAKSRPAAT